MVQALGAPTMASGSDFVGLDVLSPSLAVARSGSVRLEPKRGRSPCGFHGLRAHAPFHHPMVGLASAMDPKFELPHPPIVEAVLDIDCDLPPAQDIVALEAAALELFKDTYPVHDRQWLQEHRIEAKTDASATSFSSRHAVQAIRLQQQGGRQLVQLRANGYSFNRLTPYTALDDYLGEIERTWRIYVDLAKPSEVRQIRLRYINRILLPMPDNRVDLDRYLKLGPRVPDEDKLLLVSFLNQYTALEATTGLGVNVTLTLQPEEGGKLPIIFDNSVISPGAGAPENWAGLLERIKALRGLKNRVFANTLTQECLALFQTP